jgi:hypothetical protein
MYSESQAAAIMSKKFVDLGDHKLHTWMWKANTVEPSIHLPDIPTD